jgi:MFS family permease
MLSAVKPLNGDERDAANTASTSRAMKAVVSIAGGLIVLPGLDRRIWTLTFVRFVVTAGFAVVMPFLAMHLAVDRHVPLLRIGALWAISSGVSAALQWVAGHLADRLGRQRVLVSGMVLRSINLALLGYAVGNHASFVVIGVLAVCNGALRAFYDPIAWAIVADVSPREDRVAAFSVHRIGSSLGWVAGPLFATIASDAQYGTMFYVCAPLTLLAPIAALFIGNTEKVETRRAPGPFDALAFVSDPQFVRFLFATFAFFLLQTQMYHLLSVYAAKHIGLSRGQVGSLFTINAVLVVLLQLPTVRIIAYLGHVRTLVIGSVTYAAAFIACGLATGYAGLVTAVVLITLCEILTAPAQHARMTRLAPSDRLGGYSGAFGLFQGAAQALGPVLGVFLLEAVSPRGAWFALAFFGPIAAWLYRAPEKGPVESSHT